LLRRFAGVEVDDIEAAAGIAAVIVELGPAGQQQGLLGRQERQVPRSGRLPHMLVLWLVPGFDQEWHGVVLG